MTVHVGSFLKLALILTVVVVSIHILLFRGGPPFRLSDLGIVVTRQRDIAIKKMVPLGGGGGGARVVGDNGTVPAESTPPLDDPPSTLSPPLVYRSWDPQRKLPCYDHVMGSNKKVNQKYNFYHQKENNHRGFLYMRPPKCASSTVAGVNLRIARNEARRQHLQNRANMCDLSFTHGGKDKGRRFRHRVYDQSYLWTIIREPTARHVSFFWFWGVSANGEDSSDHHMQDFLLSQQPNYYFLYLSPRYNVSKWQSGKHNNTMTPRDMWDEVNYTLHAYDFIGITERMDESLVVLMLLLNLPMADILYYSAKTSDNLYIDPNTRNQCIKLQPSFVSDPMRNFFQSPVWQERIASDALLYRAANQSLTHTIDQLGQSTVQTLVFKLQHAQALVVERCRGKIRMECEVEGDAPRKEFDCFHHDMGCGMDCLDQVATELDLW